MLVILTAYDNQVARPSIEEEDVYAWNSLSALIGSMFLLWSARLTWERMSSGCSRWTNGFFSGARIFQATTFAYNSETPT